MRFAFDICNAYYALYIISVFRYGKKISFYSFCISILLDLSHWTEEMIDLELHVQLFNYYSFFFSEQITTISLFLISN